jgi:iron-sulfur cluster insertion protein
VQITDKAAKKFAELQKTQQGWPRIEIAAGGCNGFSKQFSWSLTAAADDLVIDTGMGQVLVDSASYELLNHAVVDWHTDITSSGFVIDIPQAASTCGCGSSFSL